MIHCVHDWWMQRLEKFISSAFWSSEAGKCQANRGSQMRQMQKMKQIDHSLRSWLIVSRRGTAIRVRRELLTDGTDKHGWVIHYVDGCFRIKEIWSLWFFVFSAEVPPFCSCGSFLPAKWWYCKFQDRSINLLPGRLSRGRLNWPNTLHDTFTFNFNSPLFAVSFVLCIAGKITKGKCLF